MMDSIGFHSVSNGQEIYSETTRVSLSSAGILHRSRVLRVSSNCDPIDGAWKCQLRYFSVASICSSYSAESSFQVSSFYCL